jgi:hypothetical protein
MKPVLLALLMAAAPSVQAQTSTETAPAETETADAQELLTQTELENLVAPVALFPDTLLIQILVAATVPMEIIKSDRLLAGSEGVDPDLLKETIEAEDYDPSVEVLATAFPEVISEMATHIEWTETMGDAMLVQSDDVMTAVQTMRTQAVNTGALVSGEQQVVEVEDDDTVIIQPADPEVVYVPQYDPQVVYAQNNNVVGDAIVTGAIVFGTFALIDAIFDDDDDWNNYWGCRNCGGWGGGPIYRNPDIDIDVDGNVNIGNRVDLSDRKDIRADGGWKPDEGKRAAARDKITTKRTSDGKSKLPTRKGDTSADRLRNQLTTKSGAADISRPNARPGLGDKPTVNRPSTRPDAAKKAAAARTGAGKTPGAKLPQANKPAIKKPAGVKRPAAKQNVAHKRPSATKKRASGTRSKAGAKRGASGGRKLKGRR